VVGWFHWEVSIRRLVEASQEPAFLERFVLGWEGGRLNYRFYGSLWVPNGGCSQSMSINSRLAKAHQSLWEGKALPTFHQWEEKVPNFTSGRRFPSHRLKEPSAVSSPFAWAIVGCRWAGVSRAGCLFRPIGGIVHRSWSIHGSIGGSSPGWDLHGIHWVLDGSPIGAR
jgi:hypothetical protein